MVKQLDKPGKSIYTTQDVFFMGDGVRLAAQIDYPGDPTNQTFPLIFVIQHATSNARQDFAHITRLGIEAGCTVFRWDKRGTGASGSGSHGTVNNDTLAAYRTALQQTGIDRSRVFIVSQNEGTLLLAEDWEVFARIGQPLGVILVGNMLDEQQILRLDTRLHIVTSKNDWNAWQIYAEAACKAHNKKYHRNASFYVAANTNRRLMYTNGGTFHRGAEASIRQWLEDVCQVSAST